jgi:anti-sigma factor RsiW
MMHPDTATLLGYLDGELEEKRRLAVEAHLGRCIRCRHEAEGVAADRDLFLALDLESRERAPGPDTEGLERVLKAMHKWQEGAAAGVRGDADLRRRLAEQLELYFGARTAELAASGREGVLAAIEPLFTTFLGRKAGLAVISQILAGMEGERPLATG